jgi:hypothetical protein
MLSVYPGCALVPALYYLLRRRRADDPKKIRDITGTVVILTLMGIIVLGYKRLWPRSELFATRPAVLKAQSKALLDVYGRRRA